MLQNEYNPNAHQLEWVDKFWYIHTTEYFFSNKKKQTTTTYNPMNESQKHHDK